MSGPGSPSLSVIIPCYYSTETLGGCLAALERQTLREFEVIVVNSSAEAATERLVRERHPEVRFLQSAVRLYPHEARNRGAELARGELLVFTDPDCEAEPEWLAVLWDARRQGHEAIVGAMDLLRPSMWEQGIHLLKFHWLLRGLSPGPKFCAATANAAYSRRLWERIGPFPQGYFAADGILSFRAARAGSPPWFEPGAVVRHRHLIGGWELCAQRFQRARDYARAQLKLMYPGSWGARLRLLFSWSALPWVLIRAARDAFRCGWGKAYLLTLPVQTAGHALWALGESCGALETMVRRNKARTGKP